MRVLDPARAAFYDTLGLQTVCPTSGAIDIMTEAICATPGRAVTATMYILIVGRREGGQQPHLDLIRWGMR